MYVSGSPATNAITEEKLFYDDIVLGFRFGVFFFAGGVEPNHLDIRFQKVSGLSAEVETKAQPEGGQNLYTQQLPNKVKYDNLSLERGMVIGSQLNRQFNAAMSLFKFNPSNVLVTLFGEDKAPIAGWLFMKAYPVKWTTASLDAGEKQVVIDTMELSYTRMQVLRL